MNDRRRKWLDEINDQIAGLVDEVQAVCDEEEQALRQHAGRPPERAKRREDAGCDHGDGNRHRIA